MQCKMFGDVGCSIFFPYDNDTNTQDEGGEFQLDSVAVTS